MSSMSSSVSVGLVDTEDLIENLIVESLFAGSLACSQAYLRFGMGSDVSKLKQ